MKVGANGYRLPSEGEWEWVARGGLNGRRCEYSGSKDLGAVGWYDKNSGAKTHEVGMKIGNELGIYDLSGNVWEWCFYQSESTGTNRVIRGGSWINTADNARVSNRGNSAASYGNGSLGFRVARSSWFVLF